MQKIVYDAGNGVCVVTPAQGVTVADAVAAMVPEGVAYFVFNADDLPPVDVSLWRLNDGVVSTVEPPAPIPIIDAIDLWSRTTDEEAEAIEGYMAQAPARARNIFRTAVTFRGDQELFGMLETAANALFSPERAAALLAPSRYE